MAGRISQFSWPEVWQSLLSEVEGAPPRWNISPGQTLAMLYQPQSQPSPCAAQALWGFTPRWSQDMQHVASHARAETVASQSFFQAAFASQRAVVPVNGFFEWRGVAGRPKQPYWLSLAGGSMYLAAVWEPYPVGDREYFSVALLTAQAAYLRRPVLIAEAEVTAWLDAQTPIEQVNALMHAASPALYERAVRTVVNDPKEEGPHCIRPA